MYRTCELLHTCGELSGLSPNSSPVSLLPHALYFPVQQHMRLFAGLILTSIPLLILFSLSLNLSLNNLCTTSKVCSPRKPSLTILAPVRLGWLNFLCTLRDPCADLCHCTWPHPFTGICLGVCFLNSLGAPRAHAGFFFVAPVPACRRLLMNACWMNMFLYMRTYILCPSGKG